MALYDGVPSIRLEGDQKRALALIPEAKVLLYKVQGILKNSGASTYSMARRVEDGYMLVLCAYGQNIIYISVAADTVNEVYESDDFTVTLHPDFYSGTIQGVPFKEFTEELPGGEVRKYYKAQGFTPTPDCIESHPKDGLVPAVRQSVTRLAVEPETPWMSELKNQTDSGQIYAQTGFLRSSMYSGVMRKVVQLVMGLGRIGAPKMRDALSIKPDSRYIKEVAERGVQVRFDYKFHRTHGITVAADGRLWLVEISIARGVLAMPLPMFPHSGTEGFKESARKRRDDAMAYAVDELGGLPTGEGLPNTSKELEAKIKAGTVLRLATPGDIGDFYDFSAYSSACGWSFSPDGHEAHNTGWRYEDDGFKTSAWFQININIGPTKKNPKKNEPIANGSAGLVKNREGRVISLGSNRAMFIPFKTYEPLLEGLLSHDGVPTRELVEGERIPKSDAPVYVCFVGNKLKVVFYYNDPGVVSPKVKTLAEEYGSCLLAGEWEHVTGERTLLPKMMYTNDYDYRREIQQNYVRETLESVDLGFKPGVAIFETGRSDHWATGVRFKGFSNKYAVTRDISESVVGAVLIPRFSRNAFYFATADWEGKYVDPDPAAEPTPDPIQTQHRDWQFNMRDPHIYSMFVCGTYGETSFFAIPDYIAESVPNRLKCRGGTGCPFVSWGDEWNPPDPRMIDHYYRPNDPCAAQYADEGPWLEGCESLPQPSSSGAFQWPTFDNRYNTTYPFRQSFAAFFVTDGAPAAFELPTTLEKVQSWWNNVSPDIYGNYQQISATHSAIGDECVIYDTAPHDDPSRVQKVTGYTPGVIPPVSYPTFVGVNIP